MIVCHCRVVSDGAIEAAVDHGARTVSAVCRRTGAGVDCGTCVFTVKALVCHHLGREQRRWEAESAAG